MKYTPGNPPDIESNRRSFLAWLSEELRRISNAIGPLEFVQVTPIDNEPAKPRKGMMVWALSVNWAPGAGEGLYVYNGATWDKVN
jgi:hypothetical protein